MTQLAWLTLEEACAHIARRDVSAVELLEATLERIAATEPSVHAFARLLETEARAAAEHADRAALRGTLLGPLHGIPFAVKDVCYTRGVPTEAGSRVLAGFTPESDAAVVTRLREAGAILVGKTVAHEFGYGQNTPATRNAWNPACYPGGTSAGSAVAVASGSAFAAIGTDTGGSIRIPAALNGVVGLKPTYGCVSRSGVVPMSPSLDTIGPLTRTVRDCALMFNTIAGGSASDRTVIDEPLPADMARLADGLDHVRIGVERDFFFPRNLDPAVRSAVSAALDELERLGAEIVPVEIDDLEYAPAAVLGVVLSESSDWHHDLLRARPTDYDPATRVMVELGELLPATLYVRAQRMRSHIQASVRRAFDAHRLDALATPTLPTATMPIEALSRDLTDADDSVLATFFRQSSVANAIGMPAVTLPCGFTEARLPIGLQFLGRPFAEGTVLRIAEAYESVTPWHTCHPPDVRESDSPGGLRRDSYVV